MSFTASLTSCELCPLLVAERGLTPQFRRLASYAPKDTPDYALLIGNPALDFLRSSPSHEIWDLGAAWYEFTHLPFVYAVWALRRGIENKTLRAKLRDAKDFGMDTLDYVISSRPEYDLEF